MSYIYKIMPQSDWAAFQEGGIYTGSEVDIADGYIHFSTQDQLVETLNKHYLGQTDLQILRIETAQLDAEKLKWEPARDSLFPHLYAPLSIEAVVDRYPLSAGPDGTFSLPESTS